MYRGQLHHPDVIDDPELLAEKALRQCVVIDTVNTVFRLNKEAPQRGVVDIREHGIVEHRLVRPIEDLIGDASTEKPPKQALRTRVRELHLGAEREEELPQVDVRERPSGAHTA